MMTPADDAVVWLSPEATQRVKQHGGTTKRDDGEGRKNCAHTATVGSNRNYGARGCIRRAHGERTPHTSATTAISKASRRESGHTATPTRVTVRFKDLIRYRLGNA